MWDLKYIREQGGTPEKLRAKFEKLTLDDKHNAFRELCWSRIRTGLQRSNTSARYIYAIDTAFDASQQQVTYSLVRGILSTNPSSDKVMTAVTQLGLSNMLTPCLGPDGKCTTADIPGSIPFGDSNFRYKLDLPTFFQILLPAVSAYTKIRWAKLFNDRNVYPLYRYSPLTLTPESRSKCAVVTARIDQMATEMGYREADKQSILQTLLYGQCFNFPTEAWYREEQVIDGEKQITKEGLRFAIPHPTRCFYDSTFPLTTFNTDTGCSYAGYWDLQTYREVTNNKALWNRDRITWGAGMDFFTGPEWSAYQMLYPCAMSFPSTFIQSAGIGWNDRENRAFQYQADMNDSAVCITSLFIKVIPKNWDLFDYEHPVWLRVQMANDSTIVYMEVLGYCPVMNFQYDADVNRAFTTSLALETIPWQDHLGNFLTQQILSVKQNLAKVVFYNTDLLGAEDIAKITNMGEKMYRSMQFIPQSVQRNLFQGQTTSQAFNNVTFPIQDTNQIATLVQQTIAIMERMLGFSAQELGAPASHEQSATETQIIATNTSVRLEFTGAAIDAGQAARKQMLYEAMLNYSNDELLVNIAQVNDVDKAALTKMGFDVSDDEEGQYSAKIKGQTKLLRLDGFSSQREGVNRINDSKIAAGMMQTLQMAFNNPLLMQAIGVDKAVELFNRVLVYAGLPTDFKIIPKKVDEAALAQQEGQQKEQQQGLEKILQGIAQAIQQLQQQDQQLTQGLQAVAQGTQQAIDKNIAEFGQALNQQVIAPLGQKTAQIAEATAQIAQGLQANGQVDQRQGDALVQVIAQLQKLSSMLTPAPTPPTMYDSGPTIPIGAADPNQAPPMVAQPGSPPISGMPV